MLHCRNDKYELCGFACLEREEETECIQLP